MKSFISCLFFICIAAYILNGQSIYLKYDESCMNRMEYSPSEGTVPYLSYSWQVGPGKIIMLDLGVENKQGVKELKDKVVNCNDLAIDKTFIHRINEGTLKLSIVTETNTQLFINPIEKASFIEFYGNTIEYSSSDAEFILYTDNLVSDVNLAKPTSKTGVYLMGTLRNECTTGYILAKKENPRSTSYKEYTLLPEIGIIEKRSISGTGFFSDNSSNILKLSKIGKISFREYLALLCDRKQADYYDGNSGASNTVYSGLIEKQPAALPAEYSDNPCAPSKIEGVHIVQKGETMYGIARRYGVSLDDLRSWNNLFGTDILSICQQLYVRKMGANPNHPVATNTNVSKGGNLDGRNYWLSGPQVHVVKPGETITMLANLYGYTEERFRKMNSLSPSENIYIGQKLHTNDCVCPTLESQTKNQPVPYENATLIPDSSTNPNDVYFREIKIHVVQKDETIFSIANQYKTTPERIMELNGLKKGESIKVDQRLYVQ